MKNHTREKAITKNVKKSNTKSNLIAEVLPKEKEEYDVHTIKNIKFENYDTKFSLERQDRKELVVLKDNNEGIADITKSRRR